MRAFEECVEELITKRAASAAKVQLRYILNCQKQMIMRKLSFKSFLRGASNDLLRCAILLLCTLIVGSSSVWADDVEYSLTPNQTSR